MGGLVSIAEPPDRCGINRIAGRKIKSPGGVPLPERTLRTPQRAEEFDRVDYSADDDAIAGVARQIGDQVFCDQATGMADRPMLTAPVAVYSIRPLERVSVVQVGQV